MTTTKKNCYENITLTLQKSLSKTSFVIPARAGLTGSYERFGPGNSSNRDFMHTRDNTTL